MSRELRITVPGLAEPGGSKRALPLRGKAGGRPIVVDANPRAASWKRVVADAALAVYHGPLLDCALEVQMIFYRPRPLGHFGTGRNAGRLKSSAPAFPTGPPDALKLARNVEDALQGIWYRNDSLIVREVLEKRYGEPARVEVVMREVAAAAAEKVA